MRLAPNDRAVSDLSLRVDRGPIPFARYLREQNRESRRPAPSAETQPYVRAHRTDSATPAPTRSRHTYQRIRVVGAQPTPAERAYGHTEQPYPGRFIDLFV